MAQNDWIVAGLNNPDFTSSDFSTIAGMDLTNTQMLSADEYLKSDFIKNHEMFKNENGSFSEDKFRQYHQQRTQDFKEFQAQEFSTGPELDMFDTDRTKDSKVKDIKFDLGRHVNPDRQMVGIEGVNTWSDPTMTKSEIAQSQKIWDTEKGAFKDYSPNDKSLINGVFDWISQTFSDPLVMAKWDSDGTHTDPITGLTTKHKAGEYKLNDKGTYYYETLNGRSPIGQEVLSVFDTLTVDGQGINKYDFFDSDDIKKSVSGVIAKNVAALLPMFTPIGGYYSTLIVAKELSKALPMLYGWVSAMGDSQNAPAWINTVAAAGQKFSGGTSQYAKENMFSFENFGNLIADVALQWGQQKTIAKAFNKAKQSQKYIDDALENAKSLYATKSAKLGPSEELWKICQDTYLPQAQKLATQAGNLGRNASLAYMAVISNSDLYNDMRAQGLTNREAAAISLGSTLGMFGLNKYTELGEIFFDDATDDAVKLARKAVKTEMSKAREMFNAIKTSNDTQTNKYLKYIKTASNAAKKALSNFNEDLKYHSLSVLGKAIGEGLEEVSEEAIQDTFKGLYELAGEFGANTTKKDIGAWDNALPRYGMSFFGGAIGGAIFAGKEILVDGKSYKQDSKNQELTTLIRNGHASELRAEVEKLRDKGKLGNTKISASKYAENEQGERVWITTEDVKDSQNHAIANAMLDKINALEAVINNNRIGLTDSELFDNMVFSEQRYKQYEKIAPLTNYYQDFNRIVDDLVAAELDLRAAEKTVDGTPEGQLKNDIKLSDEENQKRLENLNKLQTKVNELRQKKDDFLSGNNSLEYTRKLNFLIDPVLHAEFLDIDREQFFKEQYGNRKYKDLNIEEKIQFEQNWGKKVEETLKLDIDTAWNKFKKIEQHITPNLKVLQEEMPEYKKFVQAMNELQQDEIGPDGKRKSYLDFKQVSDSYVDWDSQLEGESDDDFQNRDEKFVLEDDEGNQVEESDEEFSIRQQNRKNLIANINNQKTKEWVDKLKQHLEKVGYKVDPTTYAMLLRHMPENINSIIQRSIQHYNSNTDIGNIFKNLKPDLSNVQEIKDSVRTFFQDVFTAQAEDLIKEIDNISTIYTNEGEKSIESFIEELSYEDVDTLSDILSGKYIDLEKNSKLIELITKLKDIIGEDVSLQTVLEGLWGIDDKIIDNVVDPYNNSLNTIVSEIANNPIYDFITSLKTEVKNPIGELIKTLAKQNNDEIHNVDEILYTISSDYNNLEDITQFILDDTSRTNLNKVLNYLKLVRGFIYAASSNPNENNPIGHNQIINNFAKNHKDVLTKEWEVLPELDSDYQVLYEQAIFNYINEIQSWIEFSDNNHANKIRKFVASDKAFTQAWLDTIKHKNFKITLEDQEYDLLHGFVDDPSEPEVSLFNAEQALYNNFQKILKETKLSVIELLERSSLLAQIIPSISNISKQNISSLSETLKYSDLTDYDVLQYFAQVFTLNPSEFYSELKTRIDANPKIIPIASQEYASRLAKAIINPDYRAIIKYAHEKTNTHLALLTNSLFISGVAGTGKTSVVLASIDNPTEEIILAGPTTSQGDNLKKIFNRTQYFTFEELLRTIIHPDELTKIRQKFDSIEITSESTQPVYDSEYFTIKVVNGAAAVILKKDKIKFNTLDKIPKKLILDEATHLSALELQLLDAYAESVGAVVYLAGDTNQRGYLSVNNQVENLQEDNLFCSRSPKLTISLRDNNLQKFINQEVVRSLLDVVNDKILNLSYEELQNYWPTTQNFISKFNFKVYNHEVLNGDLITTDLNADLLEKLKTVTIDNETKPASLAFIGDESSAYYKKLKEAGLNPTVLSMESMQGREFDYVVIDQPWEQPSNDIGIKVFLSDLYTTMTRATTASIFIDNGLSDIIGKNVQTNNLSKAPSILSGVEMLVKQKLETLKKFKLDLNSNSTTNQNSSNETSTNSSQPSVQAGDAGDKDDDEDKDENEDRTTASAENRKKTISEILDFEDPNQRVTDEQAQQVVQAAYTSEQKQVDENRNNTSNEFDTENQTLEIFTDTTLLGVAVSQKSETKEFTINGKKRKETAPVWTITKPETGPVRNLQAFVDSIVADVTVEEQGKIVKKEFINYNSKQYAQKLLFDIKSAIIYQHGHGELPQKIQQVIPKEQWESSILGIEVREPSEIDSTHLNAYFKESGFIYGKKRYIVNLVFKTKTSDGREAIFDIGGLPSLDKYATNLPKIKENLQKRIANATGEEKKKLEKQAAAAQKTFDNYKNLLDSWISQYENAKEKPFEIIEVPSTALKFNKTTWLQDLDKSHQHKKLQLGGKYDPNKVLQAEHVLAKAKASRNETEIENAQLNYDRLVRNSDSLEKRHPELVFSPIYTYASAKNLFDVDPSIKGKAVVFVTSDTLLRSDNLIDIWQEQKNDPANNTPRVRMLLLDNYGLNFSQLISPEFITTFQHDSSNESEERKPYRQNFTGIRMFTSLWNWRASLLKFNQALEKWCAKYNYDIQNDIPRIIEAAQVLYDEKKNNGTVSDETLNIILNKYNITNEDLNNLGEFNTTYCDDVPTFRLGFSTKGNGFYVQGQVDVRNSSVYQKDFVNLLAITPDKADQFLQLTERILSSIIPSDQLGSTNLGVKLIKEDGSDWDPDELINKVKRSLSRLLQLESKKIVLKNKDGKYVAFAEGEKWSLIPHFLSNFVRTISYFQYNPKELEPIQFAKIILDKNEETKEVNYLYTQIDDLFDSNILQRDAKDRTLFQMFDLLFHGTTEDIHTNSTTLLQLEDAYFKEGFYINPDLARIDVDKETKEIFNIKDGNGNVVFYKIATSPELFLVDTNVRASGVGLNINKLYDYEHNKQKTKLEQEKARIEGKSEEEVFKEKYPKLYSYIVYGQQFDKEWDFNLNQNSNITTFMNTQFQEIIRNHIKMQEIDKLKTDTLRVLIENGKGEVYEETLIEFINTRLQDSMQDQYEDLQIQNEELVIIGKSGQKYIMESNFNIIKDESSTIVSESVNESLTSTNEQNEQNDPLIDQLKQLANLLKQKEVKKYFNELAENGKIDFAVLINTKTLLKDLLQNLTDTTFEQEQILNMINTFQEIADVSIVLSYLSGSENEDWKAKANLNKC